MALNLAFLNRSYPSLETFKVDQEKINAFSDAIGDHNDYVKQGYASPTFLISIQMGAMEVALFDPELGLDYSKVVHGEQSFEYKKPVKAGDELFWDYNRDCFCRVCKKDAFFLTQEISTYSKCSHCGESKRCYKVCETCSNFMCPKCYDNFQIKL